MAFFYEDDSIVMRELKETDTPDIFEFASNPNVKRYIGWPLMNSLEETETFVNTLIKRHEDKTHVYGAVVEKASGKVIGTGMLFGFDDDAKHAEVGYVFSEVVWGKGYGSKVTSWLISYGFETLKRRKLFARVVSGNEGSMRVLEKNGFTMEGTIKEMYCIEGELRDCIYFGLLANPLTVCEEAHE